ncbi:MAG TPA: DUF4157 domain-containing protein [Acidimicrobiales bacterium]
MRAQAKFRVNRAGDPFEQEADRISARLTQTPDPTTAERSADQRWPREATAIRPLVPTGAAARRSELADSTGQPLDPGTRASLEPRFGYDFSQIRIHTDDRAAELTSLLAARAFTVGTDIAFAAGEYAPNTTVGQQLLVHELTHSVQQSGLGSGPSDGAPSITRVPAPVVQRAGDPTKVPRDLSCPVGTTSPSFPIVNVPFANNVGTFNTAQRAMVDDFVVSWSAQGRKTAVRVDGYASEPGDQELNWRLSCARASSTVAELMVPASGAVAGVPKDQISWFAHGETDEFSNTEEAPNRVAVISSPPPPAPTSLQELLIKVDSAPTAGDCGGYGWSASWLLAKNSTAGGHIVQHIVVDYDIQNVWGMDITSSIVKKHWSYWEAWSVKAGEGAARPPAPPPSPAPGPTPSPGPSTPGASPVKGGKPAPPFAVPYSAGNDTFADPDNGAGTKGRIVVTGDAQFYEGLVTLPTHFITNNRDTQASFLPATTTDPKFTGGTPNVDHDVTVEWDCRFSKSKTKIVSHKP